MSILTKLLRTLFAAKTPAAPAATVFDESIFVNADTVKKYIAKAAKTGADVFTVLAKTRADGSFCRVEIMAGGRKTPGAVFKTFALSRRVEISAIPAIEQYITNYGASL